jgi:hypothetical protein
MEYQRKMLQELMAPLIPNSERKFYDKNVTILLKKDRSSVKLGV